MRRFTNEPLYVAPALAGARLASPMRRLLAFAADMVILVLPTIAVAVGAAFVSLQATDPRGARGVTTLLTAMFEKKLPQVTPATPPAERAAIERDEALRKRRTNEALRDVIPLLVRTEARGLPAGAATAAEEGHVDRAVELLKDYNVSVTLRFDEGEAAVEPGKISLELAKVIPSGIRVVALLGVPALYFVLFTRSRRGATIGKWLLGIRVVRLDGERLSTLDALERFVGYVHMPATLFLTVADLWRDPNRRLPHDRSVHTAVFRMPRRAASVEEHPAHT